MKKHYTFLLLLISVVLNAQELKKVKEKFKNGKAIYYVLKSDKNIKHGEYILTDIRTKKALSKGNYFQGKKEGVWSEYHSHGSLKAQGKYRGGVKTREWVYYNKKGKLIQIYNFDDKVLVWSNLCETDKEMEVLINGEYVKSKLDCLPSCIGGLEQLQDQFISEIKEAYPLPGIGEGGFTMSYFVLVLSKEGIVKEVLFPSKGLKNEAVRNFITTQVNSEKGQWFPARLNDKNVETKIKMYFPISVKYIE